MRRLALVLLFPVVTLLAPARLAAQLPSGRSGNTAAARSSALGGCKSFERTDPPQSGGTVATGTRQSTQPLDPADLDRSISPCDDFFQFAVGGWIKNNPIPADYPSWGIAEAMDRRNREVLRQILEKAAADKSATPGSNWQKIGDYYASCMDETAIQSAGLKPLDAEFHRIAAIDGIPALQAEIARLHRQGVDAVFEFNSDQDYKNSSQVIAELDQGGIGLPDRDYYTRDDDKSKELRAAYLRHIANMFKLLGDDPAKASSEAGTVLAIETTLAKASLTNVELRDPDNTYHKLSVAAFGQSTPNLRWRQYFQEAGAPPVSSLNVSEPHFFAAVDAALASVPLADWKIYLRWHLIHSVAHTLPEPFVEENFDFFERTLEGTQKMLPRWHRCVDATDFALGEALGQFYVQQAFPPEAKAKATELVKNIIAALHDDLTTLDWMTPATRQKAIEKLDAVMIKVGYPDKWRDYSKLQIGRGPYVDNALRAIQFEVARDFNKIGKPVDRAEWGMTPPTVNAYYNPALNEIVFPAGILQPPYYDPNGDDAINYGETAPAMGHELTHGFDDEGAKFDAQGNLRNWWTPEDLKKFKERGDCIASQFSEFEIEPGLHENGKLVEGESIADLGGLVLAYNAYHKMLEGKPQPAPVNGFTADQRFFIAYAQSWEDNLRPELARLLAEDNPHPVPRLRVNGPLANMPEFQHAFACSEKSPMVRPAAKRCRIW
jgi:putative endopeptidase